MNTVTRIVNILRLAAFPLAYGLAGALVGGTLNRIMIADIGFSPALVGFFFAIPLLISPVRVWLGYRSDGFPILGRRREPYIVLGVLLTGLGIVVSTLLMINGAVGALGVTLALSLLFALYGFGRNLGHNTFMALLSDRFTGDARARAITLYEVVTLLGLVMGAGGLGSALETFDPARLLAVSIGVAAIVFFLGLVAAIGQESQTPREETEKFVEKARDMPFGQVVREVVLADPQIRLFFILVIFTIVGTLAQDVLLEPYGAQVLNMDVGDTTRLTAFWGVGVMISMILSGLFLIKLLGHITVLRAGLLSSMVVFSGLIVAGSLGNVGLFRGLVFVMGLGTGLAGAGMLTGIINFTTVVRAGLLMGVWGVANQLGRAFGSLMGGSIVDVILSISGNAFLAYSAVFAIEVVMLMVAFYLTTRLSVETSVAYREAPDAAQLAAAK
ncbi:MAG: BCD family MFS transporter [Chloroflexi bacterium]|nr:BCD family MFS transporter [Chloroflexota bacterium]